MVDDPASLPLFWEKLQVISGIVAAVFVPVAVALVGYFFSKSAKDRELGAKYIELALDILTSDTSKTNEALREWATSVINHYSRIKLSGEVQGSLKLHGLGPGIQSSNH
ncbi:MAG: hypothetical protein QNJ40_23385 [Xanthomonadales bacterium]|nr:hypothetical protein [Xanthomonadales bacterium]